MNAKKIVGIIAVIIVIFIGGTLFYQLLQTDTGPDNIQTLGPTDTSQRQTDEDIISNNDQTDTDGTAPANDETIIDSALLGNQVGDLAFDFTLQDHAGNEVTLSDYRGQTVVVNFWIFGCPACYDEFPDFQRMYNRIEEDGIEHVKMIKIYIGQTGSAPSIDDMRVMLDDNGYSFPTYWDTGEVARDYGIYYVPHTFVIDGNGIIIASAVGSVSYDALIELTGLED